MKKRIIIGVGIMMAVLVITNPTMQDFKEHTPMPKPVEETIIRSRNYNYIFFSTYHLYSWRKGSNYTERYIGIAKNFIRIN